MGVFATVQDVKDRFEGELPPSQTAWVEARITDAESLLRLKVPLLANGPAGLPAITAANARRLVVDAVLRLARNPMGVRDQTVGPFRVTFDTENHTAAISFTEEELSVFVPKHRRFGMVGVKAPRWTP